LDGTWFTIFLPTQWRNLRRKTRKKKGPTQWYFMTKVNCIYTPTNHFYVHYKKNNCKKLIWGPIKVFGHFFLLWSTNFEGNSSHIRIFIQVNWLVTSLLISLRKASIRGGRGGKEIFLFLKILRELTRVHGRWKKTQKHYHKTQLDVSSMCSQPIHQTCQQTTSMGCGREQTAAATWVFQNSVTNLPFFTYRECWFYKSHNKLGRETIWLS
jgi:hypothetical protein